MKRIIETTYVVCIVFVIANLLLRDSSAQTSTNPPPLPDSYVMGAGITNAEEAQVVSNRMNYLNQFTNQKRLRAAYDNGLITKGEIIWMQLQSENAKSQGIYGKVIDQYGNPITEVDVTGMIAHRQGYYTDDKWDKYKTETDSNGLFQFTGLKGADWGVEVEKKGYDMDYNRGWSGPRGGSQGSQTSPNNPVILTMWKVKGAEPMIHDQKFYGITPNGQTFTIDLVGKKKIAGENPAGDLLVKIKRPAQIKLNERFDWSFTMTAIGGGLIEVTNATYLNEAPEGGYQPSYEVNISATDSNWQEQIEKTFFFKSRNGQIYGHFHITVIPKYNDTSVFKIESYVNPSGSRNLEFDSKKQIR